MEFYTGSIFTKLQIAKLVLGYLKAQKCFEAYSSFLENCNEFESIRESIKTDKLFVTRIDGMCLMDFLDEYSAIYSIVQRYLEATDYYNSRRGRQNLIEKLTYLLQNNFPDIQSSSPILNLGNTVQPGQKPSFENVSSNMEIDEELTQTRTPKRLTRSCKKSNLNKCFVRNEAFNVSELITQTLLENHELHEKLADTINVVRNTPEVEKAINEVHVSMGATRELDDIIKTVVQKTEEDPVYNKMIDDIIGPAPSEPTQEKAAKADEKAEKRANPVIEAQNNDAIESIVAAAQVNSPSSSKEQVPNCGKPPDANSVPNSEVLVYDGSLDSYLKTSGMTNTPVSTPVFLNTGGLIMVPQDLTSSNQFYIVNNQPLPTMPPITTITNTDIMSMPTIIVNDEPVAQQIQSQPANKRTTRSQMKILPKLDMQEFITFKNDRPIKPKPAAPLPQIEKKNLRSDNKKALEVTITTTSATSTSVEVYSLITPPIITTAVSSSSVVSTTESSNHPPLTTPAVTPSNMSTKKVPTPKSGPHIRNLNFETPVKKNEASSSQDKSTVKKANSCWDADLRSLIVLEETETKDKVSKKVPKKRATPIKGKKKVMKPKFGKKQEQKEKKPVENVSKEQLEDKIVEVSIPEEQSASKISPILSTPIKDMIPKTPGCNVSFEAYNCTPFNEVIEEQLKGIDLASLPTPKLPITPGFSLTPYDTYNNRGTDYSTSSSYYQPSDNEQSKTIGDLIKECEKSDKKDKCEGKNTNSSNNNNRSAKKLKIINEVVISTTKNEIIESTTKSTTTNNLQLKQFNQNAVGKKNLKLLHSSSSESSSSDSSDSDDSSDTSSCNDEPVNKTVIQNAKVETPSISNIISSVEVKPILKTKDKEDIDAIRKKLEAVRQRTLKKIKNESPLKKVVTKRRESKQAAKTEAAKPGAKKGGIRKQLEDAKTINRNIKSASPVKRNGRGKAKTKPLPVKKEPVKKVRTKKEESTAKKENVERDSDELIKGLAQRGIHLIPNKKKDEKLKDENNAKVVETDEKQMVKSDAPTKSIDTIPDKPDVTFKPTLVTDIESIRLDDKVPPQKPKEYNLEILNKTIEATVFVKQLNQEMSTKMSCTPFETLINIQPKVNESGDDLMDFALCLNQKEEVVVQKPQPTKGSKRKRTRILDDDPKILDKKCKALLDKLDNIDVDMFLDKLHGE